MRWFVQKHKWLLAGAALAAILALGSWVFGWFGGDIHVMDFAAEEVDRIELFHYWLGGEAVVVTEKEDIRALMDEINSFRHTGNMLKHPKKLLPGGGELWYQVTVHLSGGEKYSFTLSHLGDRLTLSDMEMRYGRFSTCRGSMELFYELHEKYSAENPA